VYFIIIFFPGEHTECIIFGASEKQSYSPKECPRIRVNENINIYFVQTSMVEHGSSLSTPLHSLYSCTNKKSGKRIESDQGRNG
jgi:hypothetical protein